MATRRVFLQTVAAIGAAGACGGCGNTNGVDGISGDVAAGNESALTMGSLNTVDNEPVAIGRDQGGIYAMSIVCTHQGCDMGVDGSVSAQGVYCACHGSRFSANGVVLNGPARHPLPHYAVSKDASGNLTIHGDMQVAASTRLAV